MLQSFLPKLPIVSGVLLGVSLFLPSGAIAQVLPSNGVSPNNALQDFQKQDATDPLSGGNGSTGLLDLIHRANLGTGRDSGEFMLEQRELMNSEADAFRNKQQQMLGNPEPTLTQPEENLAD
ncbi:MAG: hypothetical protein ACRC2J_02345 [Microcoleaceae cyanobacterium]